MPGIRTETIENREGDVVATVTILDHDAGKILIVAARKLLPDAYERMTSIKEMYPFQQQDFGGDYSEAIVIIVTKRYNLNSAFQDIPTHIRRWVMEAEGH